MKRRLNLLGAIGGLICAVAFAVVPLAGATPGPNMHAAPAIATTPSNVAGLTPIGKHMNTKNVNPKDSGCGS